VRAIDGLQTIITPGPVNCADQRLSLDLEPQMTLPMPDQDEERRRALEKELLGQLWEGEVDAALGLLRGSLEWVRNPAAVEELMAYLERRRGYIPDYQERRRAGLSIASTRVEEFNDWAVSARCKHQGMSWSPEGVLALAVLEAARRNGELDAWRRDRALPERVLPERRDKAA
jgi:hypothetical protein